MSEGSFRRLAWAVPLLLAFVGVGATRALAAGDEEVDGTIPIVARLEPPTLGPGQEGVLVVTAKPEHGLHVYAEEDGSLTTWRVRMVEGVTYEIPAKEMTWPVWKKTPGKVEWTEPTSHRDPNFPELAPYPIWDGAHPLVLRIPVAIGAAVPAGTEIGVEVDYSACDENMCYAPIRGQAALVALAAAPAKEETPPAVPKVGGPAGDRAVSIHLEIDEETSEAVVVFEPSLGYHLYMPGHPSGDPIGVDPLPDEGITWGDVVFEDEGGEIEEPYEARIPFTRKPDAKRLRVRVRWQACNDSGCLLPADGVLVARWVEEAGTEPPPHPEPPMIEPGNGTSGSGGAVPPATDGAGGESAPDVAIEEGEKLLVLPSREVPFERVYGDDLDKPRSDGGWKVVDASMAPVATNAFGKRWQKSPLLALLFIFGFGVALAFTPCVLPIIPLTISVIGGGAAGKVGRGRLTVMLTAYVLGLSLTYGAAGAVTGALGKAIDLDAAFRIPWVVWALAAFFLVMAAGMIGIFELQPPAWMEKIRGGAAQKSGTLIGSFLLGAVAALVASPCTGPFVVSMLTFAATMGSPGIGFLLLFVLGLGMGAVFFAAGSLNLLARPGPWMVWVRYAFGVILFGVALYFLSSNRLLPRVPLLGTDLGIYVLGFGLAVLTWWGLARHLVKKEGERVGIARRRGAGMAVALVLVTGIVAQLTSHAAPAAAASGGELAATASEGWIRLRDVDHLQAEVARAKKEGRPVIVDVWATWCNYCKEFDHVIESDPHLTAQIGKFVRLKIDESTAAPADNDPLRVAAGLPKTGQPCMAFFDQEGRIRKAAQVAGWFGSMDASTRELSRRVDFLLGTPRE